jgi:hypothetical protein
MTSCYATHKIFFDCKTYQYLDEGDYGVIFVDDKKRRIVKIYKKSIDKTEKHVTDVFEAEAKAYEKANESWSLSKLVPGGFRRLEGCTVVEKNGSVVTEKYFENSAFEVDFVPGEFRKIGCIDSDLAKEVCELFHQEGIMHTKDMSVTTDKQNCIIKAIDFAIREHQLDWESHSF